MGSCKNDFRLVGRQNSNNNMSFWSTYLKVIIFQHTCPYVLKYESDQVFLLQLKFKVIITNIMSTQVTYKSDHISLLCDSTMSSTLNFCFLSIVTYKNKNRSGKINRKKYVST